ncbi:lysophospholipid acyltransferase family protein [Salinarimonas soli]|uniref:Glycerol acyltransferase n=1 Tax=Salinarimonas soli TaxID=1638099 RepID=A0A5B2VGS7_9HYPH|nr:lysophospholipid acyltransferase family protein [Salinarimonas soli]KAA2238321.1 glycerol acyltransferase [Salinarimonas soli]
MGGLAARLPLDRRPTARRNPALVRFFVFYFRRFFVRHMNAMRLARWGRLGLTAGEGPVVVYSNHPAWWDGAVYVLGADTFLPHHESYAPIDAAMMAKYGFFGRIGAYGVDLESAAGAAHFLAASADILSKPNRAIWLAAQGRFSDVRERPVGLKAGIARLPELNPDALFVPLAIEYGFWEERGGEAFLAFGAPIRGADLLALDRPARRTRLEAALTGTLDHLSEDVRSRDPARFETVLSGEAGVGGIYDTWKRLRARARGERFDPSHGGRP